MFNGAAPLFHIPPQLVVLGTVGLTAMVSTCLMEFMDERTRFLLINTPSLLFYNPGVIVTEDDKGTFPHESFLFLVLFHYWACFLRFVPSVPVAFYSLLRSPTRPAPLSGHVRQPKTLAISPILFSCFLQSFRSPRHIPKLLIRRF